MNEKEKFNLKLILLVTFIFFVIWWGKSPVGFVESLIMLGMVFALVLMIYGFICFFAWVVREVKKVLSFN